MKNLRESAQQSFQWKSHNAFILVMIAATLSIKDFLTFPLLAGENGGGAFLIIYILFLVLMGLPLMLSELLIGRASQGLSHSLFADVSIKSECSNHWQWLVSLSILASLLILSIYSVVAGWSLSFVFKTGIGLFEGVDSDTVNSMLLSFQNDPERMMLWHTLFVLILLTISAQGLKNGVEKVLTFVVPIMVLLLLLGLSYSFFYGDYLKSINYLLMADFSKIDMNVAIMAMQRAFFTLSVGLGVYFIFGSKLSSDTPIVYSASIVIVVDLLFSIITGLAINALVFTSDIANQLHDEVAFTVLPLIFTRLPMGNVFGALFFILLTIAAITTAVALLEVLVNYVKHKFIITRIRAVVYSLLLVWTIGVMAIFSYTVWSDSGFSIELTFADDAYRLVHNAGFQDVLVYISGHLLQPVIALLMVIFVGWVMDKEHLIELLNLKSNKVFDGLYFVIRFIAPSLVLIVWLSTLGVINYA